MPHDHFGEAVAARYDDDGDPHFDPAVVARTVDVLAELAGDGSALELAIGTGRVALPLRDRGVDVRGIDLSSAMVARLRTKPGGDAVPVTIGDMATTALTQRFSLVYLVFNTIMNLTSQDAQVACVANAADHLVPGGRFVVETMVPDLRRLPPGQRVVPFTVADDRLGFDTYDTATQSLRSDHYRRGADGRLEHRGGIDFRYVWPAELDLMARMAGLEPEHRWADWDRSPFTADSRSHVSVWRRATA